MIEPLVASVHVDLESISLEYGISFGKNGIHIHH